MSTSPISRGALLVYADALDSHVREMARELIRRRDDEEDAARELNIDPPAQGSPLARAFAANRQMRIERDEALARGTEAARAEFLERVNALRRSLAAGVCRCGATRAGHSGPMQNGYCEATRCSGYAPRETCG